MDIPGITWEGPSIEDVELLTDLPSDLAQLLREKNGFILYDGALHVRGACSAPEWHSLRTAWHGPSGFQVLYGDLLPSDIPFAQDQFGDQFLIRDDAVMRLFAESGAVELVARTLQEFWNMVRRDIQSFLNVGLEHKMEPGQLLHAYPPFCVKSDSGKSLIRPYPAREVILVHAAFAQEIANVKDGEKIEIQPE